MRLPLLLIALTALACTTPSEDCETPRLEGSACGTAPCPGVVIPCAGGLACVGVDVIDEQLIARCIVPVSFGGACDDRFGGCAGDLVCENSACTGANFLGPCDPAGVVVEAVCAEGETCVVEIFSDEDPAEITACRETCLSDQVDEDGCGLEHACVVAGCSRALVCREPGTDPNCQDGGEGEGEPDVGGSPGVVCIDDDDCSGGACGAYHRCFSSSCASDVDCTSEGCATASRQGNTCGSSCVPFVDAGGACRFVSTAGCDTVLPCAPGLACDSGTGTCL